jgi:polyisoprenoid-binding protein YceI
MSRSVRAAAVLPAAAVLLAAARWHVQGDGAIYSRIRKTLYVADADLGWRAAEGGPIWLGLDAVAGLMAATLAIWGAIAWLRRVERRRDAALARARMLLAIVAGATLAVPIAAFVSGMGPPGARTYLPRSLVQAPSSGIDAAIEGMPAGAYVILDHRETNLVAAIEAGGESFEARWDDGVRGWLELDPGDLRQPTSAEISADATEVKTGIGMRDRHTRDYLEVEAYPAIRLELGELESAAAHGEGVAFTARGELELMGQALEVAFSGTLSPLSEAARERLDLPDHDLLLATAELELDLLDTPLASEADAFDETLIILRAALVLRHQPRGPSNELE